MTSNAKADGRFKTPSFMTGQKTIYLPGWRGTDLAFLQHREKTENALLSEFELPEMCAEISVHAQQKSSSQALGT